MTTHVPEPSGRVLLVPCVLRPSPGNDGPPPGWETGPATFRLTDKVKESGRGHIRTAEDEIGLRERADSWTARTAQILLGPAAVDQGDHWGETDWSRGPEGVRLHRTPLADAFLPGLGRIQGVELIAIRGLRVGAPGQDEPGVLLVHLAPCEESTRALISGLYEHVRAPGGRKALLAKLESVVGEHISLQPQAHAREATTTVYPVTSVLDLHRDDDEDLLAVRAIATLTPSKAHGSEVEDSRLERARKELITLSDQWAAMVSGHGMAFCSAGRGRFPAAETYVSTLYADALAASLLTHTILQRLAEDTTALIDSSQQGRGRDDGPQGQDYAAMLQQVVALRTTLLWVRSTLLRIPGSESRVTSLLMTAMGENLGTPALEVALASDVDALMEVVELEHRVQQNRAAAAAARAAEAADRAARAADARESRTNLMLTILALVSLPLTVIYAAIDLTGSQPHSKATFWALTILTMTLAATLISLISRRDRHRRE